MAGAHSVNIEWLITGHGRTFKKEAPAASESKKSKRLVGQVTGRIFDDPALVLIEEKKIATTPHSNAIDEHGDVQLDYGDGSAATLAADAVPVRSATKNGTSPGSWRKQCLPPSPVLLQFYVMQTRWRICRLRMA
jgi:hypothetical protein